MNRILKVHFCLFTIFLSFVTSTQYTAIHPTQQRHYILSQLRSPHSLPDLSISRPSLRISWGIRVPDDDSQTVYVWLDALTAYLSGIGYPWTSPMTSDGKALWPPDIQVLGKDILRYTRLLYPIYYQFLFLDKGFMLSTSPLSF